MSSDFKRKKIRLSDYTRPDFSSGAVFMDRYEIIESISDHDDFLAIDQETNDKITIKILDLPNTVLQDEKVLQVFKDRFETYLKHQNLVEFLRFDNYNEIYFVVMKWVDGVNIKTIVNTNGPMTEENVLFFGHELFRTVRFLWENNILHRGIRPQNVMIDAEGQIKILCPAMPVSSHKSPLNDGRFECAPPYTPVEQLENQCPKDPRSEVYSVGATLFFALTGEAPFKGKTNNQIIVNQQKGELKNLAELCDASDELVDIIMRSLSTDINERPDLDEADGVLVKLLG